MNPDLAVRSTDVTVVYRSRRYPMRGVKDVVESAAHRRFAWDEFLALEDISFRVRRGEVLGMVGDNGAGKSTMLKVLARILPPTSGRVLVRGRIAPLMQLGAGFDGELTARENIELYGGLLGRDPDDMRRDAQMIAEWAGVHEFFDVPLREFSSGMLARLAFAIAVDTQPDVVLIDEVLGVGDEAFQARSYERIRELIRGGSAVVIVSHALDLMVSLADRVLWLDDGAVAGYGHPASVVASYRRAIDGIPAHLEAV